MCINKTIYFLAFIVGSILIFAGLDIRGFFLFVPRNICAAPIVFGTVMWLMSALGMGIEAWDAKHGDI